MTDDDISDSLIPNSQQLDAVELVGGSRIFTVTKAEYRPGAEQPVTVHLAEFPRPWKPGKNMRRVLAYCWGKKPSAWAGRRVELYCDEEVTFGREKVAGTRISRMSHIDGPKNAPIIKGQGKGGTWPVKPLPDAAPAISAEPSPADLAAQAADAIQAATTEAEVREWGNRAHSRNLLDLDLGVDTTLRELVTKRLAEVSGPTTEDAFDKAGE